MDWQAIKGRLSLPGFLLLALGALMSAWLPGKVSSERLKAFLRFGGLAVAVLGTLIILDFIPGL